MTKLKRVVVFHEAIFECETCGFTLQVRMANSISDFQKEVRSHEELGHQGNASYAPLYLEEDRYTGKHFLDGGL